MGHKNSNISSFSFASFFSIYSEDSRGERTCIVDDHNMATNMSPEILCQMLYEHTQNFLPGNDPDNSRWVLKEFHLGNRGEGDNPPVNTVPDPDPDATDLAETDEDNIAVVPINEVLVQNVGTDIITVFKGTLDYGDENSVFNNKTFSEVGVFTDADENGENQYMFAVKNNPSYRKTQDRKMIILWGIRFQKLS